MRFIKLFLISLVALFLLMMFLSALFPSHIRISRAIDIVSSREALFDTMSDLKTWDKWNQFIINAPLTNKSISKPASGSGAYIQSDQLKITINSSTPDSITSSWNQVHGKQFTGGYNLFQLQPGTVTVQWYFDFRFKWYPWEKLSSLLYEKQLGSAMEESLTKLKELVENSK